MLLLACQTNPPALKLMLDLIYIGARILTDWIIPQHIDTMHNEHKNPLWLLTSRGMFEDSILRPSLPTLTVPTRAQLETRSSPGKGLPDDSLIMAEVERRAWTDGGLRSEAFIRADASTSG